MNINSTIEHYLRCQADKDQYGVTVLPTNMVIDIAKFIEKTKEENEQTRWRPCHEILPAVCTEVNVSCHDVSGDTAFDYSSSGWLTPDGKYWIVDNEINSFVIAWKPLPEPYNPYDNENE